MITEFKGESEIKHETKNNLKICKTAKLTKQTGNTTREYLSMSDGLTPNRLLSFLGGECWTTLRPGVEVAIERVCMAWWSRWCGGVAWLAAPDIGGWWWVRWCGVVAALRPAELAIAPGTLRCISWPTRLPELCVQLLRPRLLLARAGEQRLSSLDCATLIAFEPIISSLTSCSGEWRELGNVCIQ